MRDFPSQVSGPLGPWYKKVNAAIDTAYEAKTAAKLLTVLGEPDEIEGVPDDDRRVIGASAIDPRYAGKYWVYVDPYRPRMRYRFGISGGKVVERARVTLRYQRSLLPEAERASFDRYTGVDRYEEIG